MDGDQALQYARSRHGSSDFDRGQRQQRVLLSLREQADPQDLIPRLPELINALKKAVRTDIPVDQLSQLLGLASSVDTKDIRSYVFTPPFYQTEYLNSPRGYIIIPNVAKIRAAVKTAFTTSPADEALREKLADEAAGVWVLYGGADRDRPNRLASYLDFHGLAASAPRQKPRRGGPADDLDRRLQRRRRRVPGDGRVPRADLRREVDRQDRPGDQGRHRRDDRHRDSRPRRPRQDP